MRNFILSSNFKNSVKASFLSLVILIASLSFGCCFNASATFDNDFPFWETNSPSEEEETADDITIYHPPCDCPSTNIYEDEFPAFGVNSPEMNIFDLYCSKKIELDEATKNFKELYNDDSSRFESNCKEILFENGVNRVKRKFNLETKLGTHGKRDFPPGTTKEKEINQNFLNEIYELSKGTNTDSVNNAETKKYPDLWQVEEKLGQDFNRSEYFRAQLMGEEYPFPLWTSSSSDDFSCEDGNNNNDSSQDDCTIC